MLTKQKMSASMAPVLIVVDQFNPIWLLSRFDARGKGVVSYSYDAGGFSCRNGLGMA
jgi:hypothetical protein